MKKRLKITLYITLIVLLIGFLIPQYYRMPVDQASIRSYAQNSYWAYPWGKSVTHKGVDIFAKKGTPIHSSTYGVVLWKGQDEMGGNVVLVLGPKWRFHYYAHLDRITTGMFSFVTTSSQIGTVGTTGNAAGKPPHLHYAIQTALPYLWRMDKSIQGWKKMFYLNPIPYLNESLKNSHG